MAEIIDKSGQKKPVQAKPQGGARPVKKEVVEENKNFRGIIRILGKDVNGYLKLRMALTHIRGIGFNAAANFAKAIQSKTGISPTIRSGDMTEEQINAVEDVLRSATQNGFKSYLLNRQKDFETNTNKHLFASDLQFAVRQDVQFQKDIKTWIGWRHTIGQKVRGQRTRNTGRSGITVGVLKKALKTQAAPAGGAGKTEAKPAAAPAKK